MTMKSSGPGGAHFSALGRPLMLMAPEGSGGGAGGGGDAPKTFTQEEVNRIAAEARENGRRGTGERIGRLEEMFSTFLERTGASAAAQTTAPAAATPALPAPAAPTAPHFIDGIVTGMGGLVDILKLSAEQIDRLGPQGLRKHHEEALNAGRERAGQPPLPSRERK